MAGREESVWLAEDRVRHGTLEVPVDHRVRGEIECGVGDHHDPDPARDRDNRPEDDAHDRGLLRARQPLHGVVTEPEPDRRDDYDRNVRRGARSEELSKPFEEKTTEDSLFSESGADDQREER